LSPIAKPFEFQVKFDENDGTRGFLSWSPTKAGSMREVILLKMNGRHRLQITVLGQALGAKTSQKQTVDGGLRSSSHNTSSNLNGSFSGQRQPLQSRNANHVPMCSLDETPGGINKMATTIPPVKTWESFGDRLGMVLDGGVTPRASQAIHSVPTSPARSTVTAPPTRGSISAPSSPARNKER